MIGSLATAPASAADPIIGQVLGAGAPIEGSIVTLWAAGVGAPTQLAQTQTSPKSRKFVASRGKEVLLFTRQFDLLRIAFAQSEIHDRNFT